MNFKKEQIKKNVFLVLYITFTILTFTGAILVIMKKVDNAGYAIIPMIFGIIFQILYRNSKKSINQNK